MAAKCDTDLGENKSAKAATAKNKSLFGSFSSEKEQNPSVVLAKATAGAEGRVTDSFNLRQTEFMPPAAFPPCPP